MHPPNTKSSGGSVAGLVISMLVLLSSLALVFRTTQETDLANWHYDILTTYETGGAPPQAGDMGISNVPSAWYADWAKHLCDVDTDGSRALNKPGCDNMYYFALPCPDFDEQGQIIENIKLSPWKARSDTESVFKNKWIQVMHGERWVYLQWADVGPLAPNATDDCDYVFGEARPAQEAGIQRGANEDADPTNDVPDSALDISPRAFMDLIGDDFKQVEEIGLIKTQWRFVDAEDVPDGPWKINVTTSPPDW